MSTEWNKNCRVKKKRFTILAVAETKIISCQEIHDDDPCLTSGMPAYNTGSTGSILTTKELTI